MSKKTAVILAEKLLKVFVDKNGRRPRILLSSTEIIEKQDDLHKLAIQFSDLGFDVDFAPTFEDTNHLVKQAIENDVHSIHLVVSAEEKMNPIEDIEAALIKNEQPNILVTAIETKKLKGFYVAEAITLLKALQN
jgi:methylmalonyl-CoA mutase